jgi:drug/metabolite transporter (DMT)-like permease
MIDALSTLHNRIRTLILLVTCGLSAIAAATVGIDDNPPGILLAFLAATAFVLAFVHPWRTSRQFRRLLYASALGFVVFGLLHNVFEAIASNLGSSGLVQDLFNGAGAALFLIATLVCPPGLLVGAVGAVVMAIRNRRRPTPGPTTAA